MALDRILATLPQKSDAELMKMRENAERLLAMGAEGQQADAEELIQAIDDLARAKRKAEAERLRDWPVGQRVVEAFRRCPPTPTEETVIRALLDHPGSTSTKLSQACGWAGQVWHTHFGRMCHLREMYLWPAERIEAWDAGFYSGILADFDRDGARFTMRPEVAAAFAELGIAAGPGKSGAGR